MSTGRVWAAAVSFMLCASSASAQGDVRFGDEGQLALSADRLFGFTSSTVSAETSGGGTTVDADATSTVIGIGWRQPPSPWSVPRLALDGFVSKGLSIGGALGYSTTSYSAGGGSGGSSVSIDVGSAWAFVVSPRIGYAYMFNDGVGIWPRAGVSFFFGGGGPDQALELDLDGDGTPDTSTEADTSVNGVAITLEVPLVLVPGKHVAFMLSPAIDLGVAGGTSSDTIDTMGTGTTSVEQDFTITDIGLHGAIVGWW